jgi:phospholipid/cholesterol/gamma-HCH transport system substrate-binding protein
MIDNADATMTAIRTAMNNLNEVVTDPDARRNLTNAIQQMPILLHEARDTLAKLNGGFELVTTNLQNFEKFTRPLGDQAPAMLTHVDSVVQDMDMLVNQMKQFAHSLNTSQGTVGQLVNNPELYNNLNSAVRQINELTKELRPIIYDARVFTDKIARHPETLGVRGAIERNPGIK